MTKKLIPKKTVDYWRAFIGMRQKKEFNKNLQLKVIDKKLLKMYINMKIKSKMK